MPESVRINGKTYKYEDVHAPWMERVDEGKKEREQYLPQIKINRKFAVGKQHLNVNVRDGRVLEVHRRGNLELVTSDILTQYSQTVIGRMTSNDYKATFITAQDNAVAEDVARQLNMAFQWGWDHEWMGDVVISRLVRHLVYDGTAALRCRFDRRFGEVIGEFPYRNGVPIMEDSERLQFMAEEYAAGRSLDMRPVREGKVVWEFLSFENLLWPPGYDDPMEFPWDLIVRPVAVKDIKDRYGKLADQVEEEDIESPAAVTSGLGLGEDTSPKIKGKALVYTGYDRPCADYPDGRTVVFTEDAILDVREGLPYPDHPAGPRTGVHYFRWQVIPGRFPGRAFIEGGIGPQKIRNKRLTQINAIMDRGLPKVYAEEQSMARPKTGEPMEIIEVRPGAPLPKVEMGIQPGGWMLQDVKLQEENAERALGIAPVTRGNPPQGVSAYSALALLSENDALKLDPIAEGLRLELVEVAWDSMEAMRSWPADKQIMVAGPENQLQVILFNSNIIPYNYLVKPPRGGALPRTQAAELQKINDIWQASGGKLPLSWYIESLNQGKAQDLPPSVGDADAHKAELENIVMAQTGEVIPVAPYEDDARHVEIHRAFQIQLKMMADMGDERAAHLHEVFEQHILLHDQAAQAQAPQMGTPFQQGIPGNPPLAPAPDQPQGTISPLPGLGSPESGMMG